MERWNVMPGSPFGALLRQFRAAANLTQDGLAERSGLSPRFARALTDLGALLRSQGELAAARRVLERARAIHERGVGADHPDMATCLQSLASLLEAQGERDAALPLFERALAIRERALGPDHPDTVATRRALEVVS